MKLFGRMRSATVKNCLAFGGDPAHVTLGLRLHRTWRRFALSLVVYCIYFY